MVNGRLQEGKILVKSCTMRRWLETMFCFFCYFDSTSSVFPGLPEFDRVWNWNWNIEGYVGVKICCNNCKKVHFNHYLLIYALIQNYLLYHIISFH